MDSVTLPSMTITQLNNFVIKLRKPARTSRAQVVQKLIRKLKKLQSEKKEDKKYNNKKERTLKEIAVLKNTHLNVLITFSLGNKKNLDEASRHSSSELTAFTRFCSHHSMSCEIVKWRKQHSDWERLANYWRSHVGRRKKKGAMPGRETLLMVEKVLVGGSAFEGLASKVGELKDSNGESDDVENGDGEGGDDVEVSEIGQDDDEGNDDSGKRDNDTGEKYDIDGDADNESNKAMTIKKESGTTKNNNKIIANKNNTSEDAKHIKSEQTTKKEKRKGGGIEEAQMKRVAAREIVDYDSSVGIQRFLMDELDEGGEMEVGLFSEDGGDIGQCGIADEKNVKIQKKVSGMFEGGEDEEGGDEDDNPSGSSDNFLLNKSKRGFDFKLKNNQKTKGKFMKNKACDDNGLNQRWNRNITPNSKTTGNKGPYKNKRDTERSQDGEGKKGTDAGKDGEMHPSWLAKKKQKELQSSSFSGKKTVFDD